MSLGDYWVSVWDAVVAEVKKVAELTEKTFYSEKKPLATSLGAYVEPATVTTTPASPTFSEIVFPFDIFIFKEQADVVQGQKDVMTLAGKVYDELVNDRTLGGVVSNLEVMITPGRRGMKEFEKHWVTVTVMCWVVRI